MDPSYSGAVPLESFRARTFRVDGPAGGRAVSADEETRRLAQELGAAGGANAGLPIAEELVASVSDFVGGADRMIVVSGPGIPDHLLAIGSVSDEPTTMSMAEVERGLQGHIDRVSEQPGVQLTEVETYAIPAGTAVRVSATFESGHVLHRAWVVAEQKPVLFVTFATSVPYDQSRPVFDVILESITYLS